MLVAIRQLIIRQPESPGLLALAAHLIHSLDPIDAGSAFSDELDADRTSEIAESVAITEAGGTDVIDSIASGRAASGEVSVICPLGTTAWIDHARNEGRAVVVVTPIGTRLPRLLWSSYLQRNGYPETPDDAPNGVEHLSILRFDDLVCSTGIEPLSEWLSDCPDVAEVARL